ncbi:cysteine-rich secretory protein 2-like [Acanthaster planci]|uniref:Cysteine-rich secretory protein 2-like n=1 Tax=Acanthaster planci TaxID=133434 RepID=A0A8B7YQI7_ACAPL|nr:cysteine-rich secretory protein 2-like [Acanthaster planci]
MARSLATLLMSALVLGTSAGDTEVPKSLGKFSWERLLSPAGGRQPRASNGQTDFNAAEVKKILTKHNELRASVSPGASDMKYMTWDANLASMAQRWADRCRFEHGQAINPSSFDPVGQNIFVRGGNPNKPPPASDFVQFWYSEVSGYHYSSNECSGDGRECGHYTQVVWADSHKVGCGVKFCSSIGNERNAWFVVCNYGPAGNFHGEKPYQTGAVCSQCGDDTPFCFRGLCHRCNPQSNSECTCAKRCKNCGTLNSNRCTCSCPNGFLGSDCGEVCEDTHRYCHQNPGWPDASFCSFDPMVPVGCPLMCGECRARDRNYHCANPNGSGGSAPPRPASGGGTGATKPKKKKKKNKKNKKGKKGKKGRKGKGKKKGRRPRSLLDQMPW